MKRPVEKKGEVMQKLLRAEIDSGIAASVLGYLSYTTRVYEVSYLGKDCGQQSSVWVNENHFLENKTENEVA